MLANIIYCIVKYHEDRYSDYFTCLFFIKSQFIKKNFARILKYPKINRISYKYQSQGLKRRSINFNDCKRHKS